MAVEVMPRSTPATSSTALTVRVKKRFASEFTLQVDIAAIAGITILFGASGAGKTTLLDCIAGLQRPDAGRIEAGDRVLFDSAGHIDVPVVERGVGYVFQDLALFPHLSVEQNVQYGLGRLSAADKALRTGAILEALRISELRARKPREISGGEQQRVALARALVTDPVVLLLDEPLAALDAPTKSRLLDDLRAWNDTHRIPILYVTHSRAEVFALANSVIVLEKGSVIARGTPHQVLGAPRQETVAELAGFENIFDTTVVATNEDHGTMTCRIEGTPVRLEAPLARVEAGALLRLAIRAGDILLATAAPAGLSARNIIPGYIASITQRDVMVVAQVDCGVDVEVHLTPGARESLKLEKGKQVWLVVKTHSCHVLWERADL